MDPQNQQFVQPVASSNKLRIYFLICILVIFFISAAIYIGIQIGKSEKKDDSKTILVSEPTKFIQPSIAKPTIKQELSAKISSSDSPNIIDDNTMIENQSIYAIDENGFTRLVTLPITLGRAYGSMEPFFDNKESIYFTAKDKLLSYNLNSQEQTEIYRIKDLNYEILKTKFNKEGSLLYVTERVVSPSGEEKLFLKEINLENKQERELPQFPIVMYGNSDYLMSVNGVDIVASFGGDGCGGYGNIYKIVNSKVEKILETGVGCSENPRFIEADEERSSILLYSVSTPNTETIEGFEPERLDSLYYQNVIDGEKNNLYDFKNQNRMVGTFVINSEKTKLAFISKNKIEIINLSTKEIEKVIDLEVENHQSKWFGDKIYVLDNNKDILIIIDIVQGSIDKLSYASLFNPVGNSPRLIGEKDGKVLLYVSTY